MLILLCPLFYAGTTADPARLRYTVHALRSLTCQVPSKSIHQSLDRGAKRRSLENSRRFPRTIRCGRGQRSGKIHTTPPHPPPSTLPPLSEEGQSRVITGGGRPRCSALTAGAPILDHMASDHRAPPLTPTATPSICHTSQAEGPGEGQAGGAGGRKKKREKSTATTAAFLASASEMLPGGPGAAGSWTHTTDAFKA